MLKIDIFTYIPILRISPCHHAIEPGLPKAGCYAGEPVFVVVQRDPSLSRV